MNLKQLNNALEVQLENLHNYLDAVERQQKALITINFNELEQSITDQEISLKLISESEYKTEETIKMFIANYKLQVNEPALKNILERLRNVKNDDVKDLFVKQKEIRDIVQSILRLNTQNRILIDHSRNFIKETVAALVNNKKAILDRKI
ncbi:MAG: flagellar export chaperone FlgN [Bacteroidota bacterium]|nr:flagellar export chaperone FlgN [Bacteroidota bacterium]